MNKKNMKFFVTLSILAVIFNFFPSIALASANELNNITKEQLPEHIKFEDLKNFKTEEEANNYINESMKAITDSINSTKPTLAISKNPYKLLTASSGLHNKQIVGSFSLDLISSIKLYADITYYAKGSFYGVEKVNSTYFRFSGINLGIDIGAQNSSGTVSNGVAKIKGNVAVDYYILIKGFLKTNTRTLNMSYNYSLQKGVYNLRASEK